jgi:hypothetical protein
MDITSPFFVVPLIVVVFFATILWSTSSKEDVPGTGDADHFDNRHIH